MKDVVHTLDYDFLRKDPVRETIGLLPTAIKVRETHDQKALGIGKIESVTYSIKSVSLELVFPMSMGCVSGRKVTLKYQILIIMKVRVILCDMFSQWKIGFNATKLGSIHP